MQSRIILLSTAYFAPVQYYSKLLLMDAVVMIDRHENYNKQSYRNRCAILSANGLYDLVVPVAKADQPKIPIAEVEIAYDTPWQKLHLKTIESAYRRSPFYEYYIDELLKFFTQRYIYLYDFNMQIMHTLCRLMKIPVQIKESQSFIAIGSDGNDFRNSIHPKKHKQSCDPHFTAPHYMQVFSDKHGFQPNLSIIDLLFNLGPEAKHAIEQSCMCQVVYGGNI